MKTQREVRDQVAAVAREIVEEFALADPRVIPEGALAAAYLQLWAWDQRAVELHADADAVRHAMEIAVADRVRIMSFQVPADPNSYEEGF